jgi:hypothetical protein
MLTAGVKGALWLAFGSVAAALGQDRIISTSSHGSELQIAGGKVGAGQILVSSNDYWGVIRAAGDLAIDFGRVTGTNYTLSNGEKKAAPAAYTYHPVNNMNNTFVGALPGWPLLTQADSCCSTPPPEPPTSPARPSRIPPRRML